MTAGAQIQGLNPVTDADLKYHLHPMTKTSGRSAKDVTVIESAKGSYVTIAGRRYFDALSGLGCVNIGYGNEDVCAAGADAMKTLSYAHSFGGVTNIYAAGLAKKLGQLTRSDFSKFFFASTGSDANESAIKIAYYYWRLRGQPERRILISRQHAYHGNTIVATSLTGIDHYHPQFGLPLEGLVYHADAPYYHRYGRGQGETEFAREAARSVEAAIISAGPSNVAAFIGEPVQSTGGIIIPPEGYWAEIRRICDKYGVLLISDEVITGFGKTGEMFGYQRFGFRPDMITMAKGITSSYFPLSSVGISAEIEATLASSSEDFEHGFTNCGHPVGAAVALANIKVIENGLVDRVRNQIEPRVASALERFRQFDVVADIRGIGVHAAIEFHKPGGGEQDAIALSALVSSNMLALGLIGRELGPSVAFVLPLVTTDEELDRVMEITDLAIQAARSGRALAPEEFGGGWPH